MGSLAVAVVAAVCVCVVIIGIGALVRFYMLQNRTLLCPCPSVRRSRRSARRYERRSDRLKKHEEVQQLSLDETLNQLHGTRAMQNYRYACVYTATHFIDESEGGLCSDDTEYVVEHGANAWEFVPKSENVGVTVHNRTEIEFSGGEHSLIANLQMPNEQRVYYYEVRLDSLPDGTNVAVGVAMKDYPPLRMAGWARNSVAFHTIDGCAYYCHPLDICRKDLATARTSDTLGVGWRPNSGKLFFTVNGAIVCHIRTPWSHKRMYPIVSADGPCCLNVNVGARAFVLSHGNMRYWGLAPSEGARPPPPMYQNVSETILLSAHSDPLVGSQQHQRHTAFPPSYDESSLNSQRHPAKHTVIDMDDLSETSADELYAVDGWSQFSSASGIDVSRIERVHSSPSIYQQTVLPSEHYQQQPIAHHHGRRFSDEIRHAHGGNNPNGHVFTPEPLD
ncbi:Protein ssh4 [Coemansia spiralis]|uniref:Protein ssh4 n=2 Tax=Coemansia TaxID=4863 RepID=A0A9W8G193_9FUNG|nr:hypothetical protein BX070DRAFT_229773 [Coemansia spiralis]KAJ1988976.1 Protein ssh4 [Coemansia umbellata]KAJ2620946.1 Protein ssh4 [Coemansia sp. RSA 1358]KAJ2675517.1 Protein ssh4 [Coemansia spiralis]